MLVWRFCPRGRLWAALIVAFTVLLPTWAMGDVLDHGAERAREQIRANHGQPEAIAAVAALAQDEESLLPGQMARVLRETVDGKLGGPADPLVASQAAYLLSLEEDRRGDFSRAEELRTELGLVRDFWVLGPFDAQGRSGFGRAFPVPVYREFEYVRHGVLHLFAAFNVRTGRVLADVQEKKTRFEFIELLEQCAWHYKRGDMHCVLDNASYHFAPEVKDWLARHPRFQFHFTPTHGSWLNQVECWFSLISRKAIRRGVFDCKDDLHCALMAYVSHWNALLGRSW